MGEQEKAVSTDQAYRKMTKACSRKEYCVFDIRRKLLRMGLSGDASEPIIQRLKEERFIDEKRYVHSFINDKLRFNKWGRKKIEIALLQKQLPKELIEEAFLAYPKEVLSGSLPALLAKKWPAITGKSRYEKEAKLIRYALGRGFSMLEIKECLKDIQRESGSDDVPFVGE